jgi:hypothetical protein
VPDLPWFVYAILLAPLGLLLFAAAYKTLQVRAARDWPSTPGKVVISNVRRFRMAAMADRPGHMGRGLLRRRPRLARFQAKACPGLG